MRLHKRVHLTLLHTQPLPQTLELIVHGLDVRFSPFLRFFEVRAEGGGPGEEGWGGFDGFEADGDGGGFGFIVVEEIFIVCFFDACDEAGEDALVFRFVVGC